MSDENVQNIVTRVTIEGADKVQSDGEKIRIALNEIKESLLATYTAGAGKERLSDTLRGELNKIQKEIEANKKLLAQAETPQTNSFGEEIKLSKSEKAENKAYIAELLDENKELKLAQRDLRQIAGELKKEFKPAEESTKALAAAQQQLVNTSKPLSEILQNVGANTNKSKEGMDAWRAGVDGIKASMTSMSQTSGKSIADVGAQFKREAATMGGSSAEVKTRIQAINQAMKELKPATQGAGQSFLSLGQILQTAFGIGLYDIIRQTFEALINYLKQATVAGYEFAKSMFQLQVGINAMRRTGVDITAEDVLGNIQVMKEKYGTFSTADLVKGSGSLINLIRDFGFAKEQIFELQDAIATLAIVNGRSMDEVQKTVALTLSSGYTEGLQRLGVSINRVTIALEAQRLGWGRNYLVLTESQRAIASYNIILAKTAKYQNDLEKYQMSAPGQADKLTAAWKDFTATIGVEAIQNLAGLLVNLTDLLNWATTFRKEVELLAAALGGVNGILVLLTKNGLKSFSEFSVGLAACRKEMAKMSSDPSLFRLSRIEELDRASKAYRDAVEAYKNPAPDLADIEKQAEEENKLVETIDKAITEIEDLTKEEAQTREDLLTDLQRSLEDIERDGAAKRAEIERDYIQTIKDLNINLQRDLAEAYRSYQYDLQKLATDTANRRAEIEREYAQKVLENQQDLQKKLHRLREEYVFDLDEAIRGGDVRQVRKLMRQYTFDKHKVVEDQKDVTQEAKQEYEQQLADLQRSDAQKRQELLISYQQKIVDIRTNFQQQVAEAAIQRQQELDDLKRSMQEQRDERQRQYAQQLSDLQLSINRKLQTIAAGLSKEIAYTDAAMKRIYESAYAVLGPNGNMDKLLQYYKAMWGQAVTGTPGTTGASSISAPDPTKFFASGGTLLATKPTMAVFGERPEVVTFQPLGSNTMGSSSSDGGRVVMKISLSPGLEASIVENALDEFSKVLMSVERSR